MILAAQLCRTVGISDDPEKQSEMRWHAQIDGVTLSPFSVKWNSRQHQETISAERNDVRPYRRLSRFLGRICCPERCGSRRLRKSPRWRPNESRNFPQAVWGASSRIQFPGSVVQDQGQGVAGLHLERGYIVSRSSPGGYTREVGGSSPPTAVPDSEAIALRNSCTRSLIGNGFRIKPQICGELIAPAIASRL
jgi:hypothetical protein